jgi:ABC-type uncharacterized transport system permease subunit
MRVFFFRPFPFARTGFPLRAAALGRAAAFLTGFARAGFFLLVFLGADFFFGMAGVYHRLLPQTNPLLAAEKDR